jgi:hypothetical protein
MAESEIPEDIRAKAADAVLRGGGVLRTGGPLHIAVAEAILAERLRQRQSSAMDILGDQRVGVGVASKPGIG